MQGLGFVEMNTIALFVDELEVFALDNGLQRGLKFLPFAPKEYLVIAYQKLTSITIGLTIEPLKMFSAVWNLKPYRLTLLVRLGRNDLNTATLEGLASNHALYSLGPDSPLSKHVPV